MVEVVRGCASLALARWRWQRALKKKETTPTQMSTNTAMKAITPHSMMMLLQESG